MTRGRADSLTWFPAEWPVARTCAVGKAPLHRPPRLPREQAAQRARLQLQHIAPMQPAAGGWGAHWKLPQQQLLQHLYRARMLPASPAATAYRCRRGRDMPRLRAGALRVLLRPRRARLRRRRQLGWKMQRQLLLRLRRTAAPSPRVAAGRAHRRRARRQTCGCIGRPSCLPGTAGTLRRWRPIRPCRRPHRAPAAAQAQTPGPADPAAPTSLMLVTDWDWDWRRCLRLRWQQQRKQQRQQRQRQPQACPPRAARRRRRFAAPCLTR